MRASGETREPPSTHESDETGATFAAPASLGRRVGLIVLVLCLLLGPVCVRVWIDGRAALSEADAAAERGDSDAQVRWLGRAARWSLPLASHDDQARDQLHTLGLAASEAGEIEHGLAAWRELRRSIVATRTLGIAGASEHERLGESNAAIVELMVAQAEAAGTPIARERWVAQLEEDLQPRWRSVLAAGFFAVFLFACIGFFALGLDAKGRLEPRWALRFGVLAMLATVSWIALF